MASGGYNTQAEWLSKINQDLSMAMTCSDADLEFLTGIQTAVIGKLRNPQGADGGAGAQLPPPGPPPGLSMGPGMPAGLPPGMPPPMPPGMGPGALAPGITPAGPGGASSNPDELRRALSL